MGLVGLTALVLIIRLRAGGSEPGEAVQDARAACARMHAFERLVAEDASAATVMDELRVAWQLASEAASEDATWVELESGIASVEHALAEDDPRAASLGMAVVRSVCTRLEDEGG